MPIVKKYDDSYNFKVEAPFNNKQYRFFVFLEDNILVGYPVDSATESTDSSTWAICVNPKHGLMIWDSKNSIWTKTSTQLQQGFLSYIAEKEILK